MTCKSRLSSGSSGSQGWPAGQRWVTFDPTGTFDNLWAHDKQMPKIVASKAAKENDIVSHSLAALKRVKFLLFFKDDIVLMLKE